MVIGLAGKRLVFSPLCLIGLWEEYYDKKQYLYDLLWKLLYQSFEESKASYIDDYEKDCCEEYQFILKYKDMCDWLDSIQTKPWPAPTDLGKMFDDFIFNSDYRYLLYSEKPGDNEFVKGFVKIAAKRNIKKDFARFEKEGITYSCFDFVTGKISTNASRN
jgi:hypothetical protein